MQDSIFDRFSSQAEGSSELDPRTELRNQLQLSERLQKKLKSLQKFTLYDPLLTKVNPVHLEPEKLDELFKRKMMQ